MKTRLLLAALSLAALLSGCRQLARVTAPKKRATATRAEASLQADTLFWAALHGGRYQEIPAALEAVTAAYLANPADAVTASHVGWLHIWRLAESARLAAIPATITDDAVLARKYFQEAVQLDPAEARYLGFLASSNLAEASIHHDERLTRQGYYQLLDAIDGWPEFNLFTASYVMSRQPAGSKLYNQALEWQWRTLDACTGETVSRTAPDYAPYMKLATTEGRKRVCWNSWIAPHNFEGFFLNMGDMLVKSGDWQKAATVYAFARLSPTYAQWPFGAVLEDRIANAEANVARFTTADPTADPTRQRMMGASTFACVACHQE